MRVLIVLAMLSTLAACGTVSGAMSGAGRDLQKAGDWLGKKTESM